MVLAPQGLAFRRYDENDTLLNRASVSLKMLCVITFIN